MFPRLTDNNDSGGSPAVFCDVKFAVGQVIRYPASGSASSRSSLRGADGGHTAVSRSIGKVQAIIPRA